MQIESPCHENYSKMEKRRNGRYCSSCEKMVVDFTGMSNEQVTAYLKKQSSQSLCIRAKSFQLEDKNRFENLIYNLRERIFAVRSRPLKLAFLGLISGITVFTSSCIGKRMDHTHPPYWSYDENPKDSVATSHQTPSKKN